MNTIVLKRIVDRKPKKFNSKMALNIAILFTTLLIIGEYKGAQCAHDVLVYMKSFDMEAFDEFNMMCYVSMCAFLLEILYFANNSYQYGRYTSNLLLDIKNMNKKLHRINTWTKFLNISSENLYNEIINAIENYKEEDTIKNVRSNLKSIYNGSNLSFYDWTTPKVNQFFQIIHSNQAKKNMINMTYGLCKNILLTLSEPTENIEINIIKTFYDNKSQSQLPVSIIYGSVLLLMTEEKINHFLQTANEYDQKIILVASIESVVQDIYRGIIYILNTINTSYLTNERLRMDFNSETIDIKLLRMMMQMFFNVVQLTSHLYDIKQISGVNDKLLTMASTSADNQIYAYNTFKSDFHATWKNKFEEPVDLRKGQPLSTLADGPLIRNNKVIPSIIAYYTVYDELWENVEHLKDMEKRIVMLLELNAWTKMLYHQVIEIKNSLLHEGYLYEINQFPNFSDDMTFVMDYEQFFQTAT